MRKPFKPAHIALASVILALGAFVISHQVLSLFSSDHGSFGSEALEDLLYVGAAAAIVYGIIRRAARHLEREGKTASLLTTTLESITDAFFTVDREWKFTYVNRMAEELLQRRREDLIGRDLWVEFPDARNSIFEREYRGAMESGATAGFEALYAPLNAWFAVRAYPSDIGLAVYFRDITQRRREQEKLRENEERLQYITRATNDAIWEYEAATDKIRWSEGFEALSGYKLTESEMTGKFWEERVHPEDRPRVVSGIDRALAGTDSDWSAEYRFLRQDGRYAHVQDRGHILRDADGKAVRMIGGVSDFTERARAEEALRESESRFREMADNIKDVFYNFDAVSGRVLYISPAYAQIWGRSVSNVYESALDYIEGIHPDDREAVLNRHGDYSDDTTAEMEYRVVRPDGTISWVQDSTFRIYTGGEVDRIVGTVRDISEGKRVLEALRETELHLTRVLDNLPGMAYRCLMSPDWTMLLTSQGSLALTGYDSGQLLNNALVSYGSLILPRDRERILREVRTAADQDQPFELEYGIRTREGEEKRLWERGRFFPGREGSEGYLEGFIMDVTARKNAEADRERLTAAVDQLAEIVMITDATGSIQYVNPAFERITGYGRDETIGRNPRILKSGVHDSGFYSDMWSTLASGRTWMGRMVNRKKDGTHYSDETIISPVRDSAGLVINYIAIQNDITGQLILEEQYRQAQKMEAVGRLAGGVAHDFNNMLTVILVRSELALRRLGPEDPLRPPLNEIRDAAERSAALTKQLLTYARRQAVTLRALLLNDAVEAMLQMLRRLIGEHIELDWIAGKDLWQVRIDPAQIDQLLSNLCLNARDAIADVGRIVIETRNMQLDEEHCRKMPGCVPGEYVLLAISDSGSGMDKSTLSHLFEPFFTTKDVGKGTGLGLATVYGIIKQNNGFINVYSELGEGTIFRVYLPRHAAPGIEKEASPEVPIPRANGETVLLVEDEPMILEATADILEGLGYAVIKAGSPSLARKAFAEHAAEIHLLMTDVIMPEMNGVDLAKHLQEERPALKSLFMSGYNANVALHRGITKRELHFVQKPFTERDLAHKVRDALNSPGHSTGA
jgi:PAS domain S-box-containing protein